MREIILDNWYKKIIYYIGWISTILLAIGIINGISNA